VKISWVTIDRICQEEADAKENVRREHLLQFMASPKLSRETPTVTRLMFAVRWQLGRWLGRSCSLSLGLILPNAGEDRDSCGRH
jgi:hypothetical protein